MKKLLLSLLVVVFSLTQLSAQQSTFEKGDKVVNLGIGMGSTHGSPFAAIFSGSFDLGIVDNIAKKGVIGVGGYLGFSTWKYVTYWRTTDFLIAARGTFHYPLVDKLDTYAGVMLGYDINSHKYTGPGSEPGWGGNFGGAISSLFVGIRYYLSKNFAVMSEANVGYGPENINVGIALKF
jgi:hypothetical protein